MYIKVSIKSGTSIIALTFCKCNLLMMKFRISGKPYQKQFY